MSWTQKEIVTYKKHITQLCNDDDTDNLQAEFDFAMDMANVGFAGWVNAINYIVDEAHATGTFLLIH